jgi:predicted DsbA family dithiol-disulfide isomerase
MALFKPAPTGYPTWMNQPKNLPLKLSAISISVCLIFGLGYLFGSRKTATPTEENQIYAVVNGDTIRGAAVWPKIKEDLRQLEKNIYMVKKRAVEELLMEKSQEAHPQDAAAANDKVEYSKEDFAKFLKERNLDVSKLNKKAQDDLIANFKIHTAMLSRKAQDETALKAQKIEWRIPLTYLDPPIKVGKGFLPGLAASNSARTLVVFANYHCPNCLEAQNKIKSLQEKFKDKINIYFRFSLQEPETSIVFLSALAASCANDQSKFAEYHQALFEKLPKEVQELSTLAESIGLKMTEFTPCLQSMKHKKNILTDTAEAEKLGLNRQAVAFANGYLLQVQEPLETFETVLNQNP